MNNSENTYNPRELFHVAVIIGAHGVRGELKAKSLTEVEGRLESLQECSLLSPDEKTAEQVKVDLRRHQDIYLLTISGVNDREGAEKLKGSYLAITREQAGELPEGRWYVADLVGCRIFTDEHGEVGTISDVISGPGSDIFIIARKGKKDLLLPILDDTLVNVDIEGRRVDAMLPDGLWDIYE